MHRSRDDDLNFLEALFGLMLQPGETSEELLGHKDPPYATTLLFCLLLTIFVPVFSQLVKYGMTVYDPEAIFSLFLVVTFSLLFFILLEGIFLRILRVEFNLKQLFATTAYCTAPFLLALWLIYFFNYLSTGRLSLLQIILTGYSSVPDRFIHIVPIALLIALLNILVVFFYCVRFIGQLHSISAMSITVLSSVPLLGSLVVGVIMGEFAHPGTANTFMRIITSPSALVAYAP